MPHWPSQVHPGDSQVSFGDPIFIPSQQQPRTIHTAELGNPHMLRPIPSTHPSPSNDAPQTPSRHGRSISHPFPSLLASPRESERRKKLTGAMPGVTQETDELGNTDAGETSRRKKSLHDDESRLRTGNCSTCDSTVRWPKHLDVYRCTSCLMINDVQPLVKGESSTPRMLSANRISRKPLPVTAERAKIIADQCVAAFLKERALPKQGVPYDASDERFSPSPPILYRSDSSQLLPETDSINHTSSDGLPPWKPDGLSKSLPTMDNLYTKTLPSRPHSAAPKRIFDPLEQYLSSCLKDCDCLNASFALTRPQTVRAMSDFSTFHEKRSEETGVLNDEGVFELDAKVLLLGDIGENGQWWTGNRRTPPKKHLKNDVHTSSQSTDRKMTRFDWNAVYLWYEVVLSCGKSWRACYNSLSSNIRESLVDDEWAIDGMISEARYHVQRTFLKYIENLLRRPGRPLKTPDESRFLLILFANPLLNPERAKLFESESTLRVGLKGEPLTSQDQQKRDSKGIATGQHSGIVKRVLGLMANLPPQSHQALMSWFFRMPELQFRDMVELIGGFVSYRLSRQKRHKWLQSHDPAVGLIPDMSGPGGGTPAQLHAAIGSSTYQRPKESKASSVSYQDDWQIKSAAKVMSLFFSTNSYPRPSNFDSRKDLFEQLVDPAHLAVQQRAWRHSQLLPTSFFYNTRLDYVDLIADFDTWESRRGRFSFCQYPMFLSIWAKIHVLEYDARRQMEIKARDAFFTSILSRKAVSQYLVLRVRRDCLADDSLRSVSEVVGSGQEEVKKGLRIEFVGEEGVDAGGLRKEWFLLLTREVFDPNYGLFVYDDDSNYCYFNPNSFETSDQFFLVGVVLGLAIYNSTILDVALPPFAFRKLLASAPSYTGPNTTAIRPSLNYTLDDLAEWKPALARGLQKLLRYEGDVQETFCRDFVADVDRYGQITQVPLCPNGERRPVTNSNRREFVDLYIRYMLDTAVARQYEPFKRGFYTICGGNALSLFRPEEIELLIRGSDEPLDIASLKAVAVYENWDSALGETQDDPIVAWFWEILETADIRSQKEILTFITGSDRIPAMGATSLIIKLVCLGDDSTRFPIARTCFNVLGVYRYHSKSELESKLWRAVADSEGFGLK